MQAWASGGGGRWAEKGGRVFVCAGARGGGDG